jgi:hypothetical protein
MSDVIFCISEGVIYFVKSKYFHYCKQKWSYESEKNKKTKCKKQNYDFKKIKKNHTKNESCQ